ncbi:hypothetical protein MG295_00227 [Bacillus phage vB_BcgM]|nr:hypothetical protein MG295_00227 [Bacillus phage vB_BcgM]
MSNIIIELIDGSKLVNDPALGWNLDTIEGIIENLDCTGKYDLNTHRLGWTTLRQSDIADIYIETDKITVVGGGHKYVKLQHVFELMKHAENMWSLPYYEFDKLGKTKEKIDNTMAWLERNAKTKEELK